MQTYKYKGTEEQLVECGFDLFYSKATKAQKIRLRIFRTEVNLETKEIKVYWVRYKYNKLVELSFNNNNSKIMLADLIEKGLVEVQSE